MMGKLSDKLWYMICYGQDIKSKDLPDYAKECATQLQDDLRNWIVPDIKQVFFKQPNFKYKENLENGGHNSCCGEIVKNLEEL